MTVRSTKQMSITLPHEMAQLVKDKVASGEYATESEVIRDGLRVLLARDRVVDEWLRNTVAPAYDAMKIDISGTKSLGQIHARLAKEHESEQSQF